MYSKEEELARRRVKKKKGFYIHLAVYILVNLFIFLVSFPDNFINFDFGPALPWGIGLAFHYLGVFGFPGSGILTREWEEKEYEKELRKMNKRPELPKPNAEEKEELELKELRKNWNDKDLV